MGDYTKYGTPLRELEDDEAAPKRFQDDTVRDERGRRRFHGAFTGGFSAGYFNSVGTKEGWTPQNFVSSRSQRAETTGGQRPEDFMDSEDLGEMGIAPRRVRLREGVRTQEKSDSQIEYSRTAGVGSQRELLQAPLIRMLATDRESVGVRILRSMGWRPGRGVGPAVTLKASYGPQLPESVSGNTEIGPDEITDEVLQALTSSARDNVWGLGYSPAERMDLFGERIDRERVTMSTATVEGRRVAIRGQAFGVGAFEEDDEDIYAREDMTQYNFEAFDQREQGQRNLLGRQERPMIESKRPMVKGGVIEGFVAAKSSQASGGSLSNASRMGIQVPPGWTPRAATLAVAAKLMNTDLADRVQRPSAEISREDKVALISDKSEGSVFDLISAEDKNRIAIAKKAIQERALVSSRSKASGGATERIIPAPSVQEEETEELDNADRSHPKEGDEQTEKRSLSSVHIESLRPFASDPMKQERFERFIRFSELGRKEMLASIQPPSMSQWEAAIEKKEFESAVLIVRPQLGLSSRFAKTITEGAGDSNLPTGLSASKEIAASQSFLPPEKPVTRGPPIRPLKEFGKNTHSQIEWHPKALLCKRFNVPDPYPGDDTSGIPSSALCPSTPAAVQSDSAAELSKLTEQPSSSKDSFTHKVPTLEPAKSASSSVLGSFAVKRFDDLIEEEEVKTPPPVDFFKFIFSDDEDEDDTSEDQKQDIVGHSEVETPSSAVGGNQISSATGEQDISASQPSSREHSSASTTKKSSGLFADLDLSLLNKRPQPKPIPPLNATVSSTAESEAALPPMGPKPPPVIAIETTRLLPKRHHHSERSSSRGEKRKKDSKKGKKEKKSKKAKKKDSKKSKKRKKDRKLDSDRHRQKRARHGSADRSGGSSASANSSDGSSEDSGDDGSEADEKHIDQRLREKLRKLRS